MLNILENYQNVIKKRPEYLGINRYCNICGFRFLKFAPFGARPREAKCPVCYSLERHRHLYIHLLSLYPFLADKNVLHFAPEKIIKKLFLNSSANYYDADIDPTKATHQVDITNIPFSDNFFDYIICIHVLEHIPDDQKAMQELYRVLKPGGIAYLAVPLRKDFSEDLSITDPDMRTKLYGQFDHVRYYNLPTFLQRLNTAGFNTERISDPSRFPGNMQAAKLLYMIVLAAKT